MRSDRERFPSDQGRPTGCPDTGLIEAQRTAPVARSRTKTLGSPVNVNPGTRSVAVLRNATNRPSLLTAAGAPRPSNGGGE
jgi:hypothetical protein